MYDLKGFDFNARRQDMESVAIKNWPGARVEIKLRDSKIAQHSAVKEEDEGGRLLEKEICSSGIKKEKPAERGEIEPSVQTTVWLLKLSFTKLLKRELTLEEDIDFKT